MPEYTTFFVDYRDDEGRDVTETYTDEKLATHVADNIAASGWLTLTNFYSETRVPACNPTPRLA